MTTYSIAATMSLMAVTFGLTTYSAYMLMTRRERRALVYAKLSLVTFSLTIVALVLSGIADGGAAP